MFEVILQGRRQNCPPRKAAATQSGKIFESAVRVEIRRFAPDDSTLVLGTRVVSAAQKISLREN